MSKMVVTAYIDSEIGKRLDDYCEDKGVSRSRAIAKALQEFLEDFSPEELPEGWVRVPGGSLKKKVKTRLGYVIRDPTLKELSELE